MPDLTITLTPAQASRVADAIGDIIHEDKSPASLPEAKQYVINKLKSLVRTHERHKLEAQVVVPPDIDPT